MGVNIREKNMIDTTSNRIQTRKRNRDTNVTGKGNYYFQNICTTDPNQKTELFISIGCIETLFPQRKLRGQAKPLLTEM